MYVLYIYVYEETEGERASEPHMIVGAGKSKICRAGRQAGDPGKSCYSLESEGSLEAESFLLWQTQSSSL